MVVVRKSRGKTVWGDCEDAVFGMLVAGCTVVSRPCWHCEGERHFVVLAWNVDAFFSLREDVLCY